MCSWIDYKCFLNLNYYFRCLDLSTQIFFTQIFTVKFFPLNLAYQFLPKKFSWLFFLNSLKLWCLDPASFQNQACSSVKVLSRILISISLIF